MLTFKHFFTVSSNPNETVEKLKGRQSEVGSLKLARTEI